jgi:signal transduction histidine kinase
MDWDTAIRSIVQYDAEALGVDRVSFWHYCGECGTIGCDAGYVTSLRSFEHGATLSEPDLPEYFQAMREERVMHMSDVQTDPRCLGLRDYCSARGIASMLDVPVWSEGGLCGVLCHEHVGPMRRWTDGDVAFVTGIGQIVSFARAARAHTQAGADARRASFLDSISRALSSLEVQVVARRAVALCVPKVADVSLLWLRHPEGRLECVALESVEALGSRVTNYVRSRGGAWMHEGATMATRVVMQGQSLVVPEFTPQVLERYCFSDGDRAAIRRVGFSTGMSVPLAVAGKVFGAMSFFGCGDRHFTPEDLKLAENIAHRVAPALENARLYNVAREAIHARDELLAVAAHELRTPLTPLLLETGNLVRLAQRRADPAEAVRSERIAAHVRRFCGLVDHVLDALRIRTDGVRLERSRFDLAALVRDRAGRIAPRAQAAASAVAVDCPPSLTSMLDQGCIERVIDVLLDNAVKFGRGKPIAVSLRGDGTWAELSVRDHGGGIAADRLSSIFQPFERACPIEHFGGVGLGLYIANAMIEAHGGSIAATSSLGEGATFVVRLPIAASSPAEPGHP